MVTWHQGVKALHRRNVDRASTTVDLIHYLRRHNVARVSGTGVFLTQLEKGIPPIIVNYIRHTHSLPETAIALTVKFERIPRVSQSGRIELGNLNHGLWHLTIRFGFLDSPDLPLALAQAKHKGLPIVGAPTYFVERYDPVSSGTRSWISRCPIALFGWMSRNAAHAVDRFKVPSNSLVEIGRRIEL
ncbi:KUP/HAK/KT family potassium transporter [Bradyrhizobium sp. 2TAF36]|uniref:KUP/HAK/KT family potassium transporter n=1 Tax=Bradyrhizobium sp. 2TAF36 TaxID=3233016 RepID=UPI003F8EDD7A